VGDGEVEDGGTAFREPRALFGDAAEFDPAVFEAALGVIGEGGGVPIVGGELRHGTGEEAGFDEDLEAVADAEDEVAIVDELAEGGAEVVDELVGEDFAGGDVVAVGEAAGEGEDLELLELGGVGEESVDVEGFDGGAHEGEGVVEFAVAVGAGGAEEEDAGGGHRVLSENEGL